MNPKIKITSKVGAVLVGMILTMGIFTFTLSSHLQSADAKKDEHDKSKERLGKKAEAAAMVSDRGEVDIFGSNGDNNPAIGIDGADANVRGTTALNDSPTGTVGTNGTIGTDGTNGTSGTDGADGIISRGADSNNSGTDGGEGASGMSNAG